MIQVPRARSIPRVQRGFLGADFVGVGVAFEPADNVEALAHLLEADRKLLCRYHFISVLS